MAESTQHILDRVRPPRVQITYDVEIGNAIEMKELPFVVGILADLSGVPEEAPAPIRERKFVEIDGDSFDHVMSSIAPRLPLTVDNKLANDGTKIGTVLNFKTMDDFSPVNVIKQVEPMADLYAKRTRMNDLLAKLDGNQVLADLLQQLIDDPNAMKAALGSAQQLLAPQQPAAPAGDAKPAGK